MICHVSIDTMHAPPSAIRQVKVHFTGSVVINVTIRVVKRKWVYVCVLHLWHRKRALKDLYDTIVNTRFDD